MADTTITNIVDTYLREMIDSESNSKPGEVEKDMLASGVPKFDGWKEWLPIASRVTDEEINEFENRMGHKLPPDYIIFLKYKHFYHLEIGEADFCSHPVNTWRASLTAMMLDSYPKKYLFDKGFLPFANWSDWGCLCFDTNRNFLSANYPIVLWDHEIADWTENVSSNFKTLLKQLDKQHQKLQQEE